jgi:hypothetical protein
MLGIKVLFYKGWEFFWRQALIARTISSYYILKCKYEEFCGSPLILLGKGNFLIVQENFLVYCIRELQISIYQ